jgi:hypothetical protein
MEVSGELHVLASLIAVNLNKCFFSVIVVRLRPSLFQPAIKKSWRRKQEIMPELSPREQNANGFRLDETEPGRNKMRERKRCCSGEGRMTKVCKPVD